MRMKKNVKVSDIAQYDIVLSPVVTEKSTLGGQHNQVTFRVARKASKPEIKAAVEQIFGVTVNGVNTLNYAGKVKRFKGRLGRQAGFKKAVVRLAEGSTIDVGTGV